MPKSKFEIGYIAIDRPESQLRRLFARTNLQVQGCPVKDKDMSSRCHILIAIRRPIPPQIVIVVVVGVEDCCWNTGSEITPAGLDIKVLTEYFILVLDERVQELYITLVSQV